MREQIGGAILREASEFILPWQMRPTIRALKLMPNAAWDVAARKMR